MGLGTYTKEERNVGKMEFVNTEVGGQREGGCEIHACVEDASNMNTKAGLFEEKEAVKSTLVWKMPVT